MPYPEQLVAPMRDELVRLGVDELRTATDVDEVMDRPDGSVLLVVNSVCGCAAANARPAVALARQHEAQPDRWVTVFAGQDQEATARARDFLPGIPPSSPFMALLVDGEPAYVLERRHIEGRSASAIAGDLVTAFDQFLGADSSDRREASEAGTGSPGADAADPAASSGPTDTFRSIL